MRPVIISLFEPHPMLNHIASKLNYEIGDVTLRHFPDGESYIKFNIDINNRDLIILNSLDYPDAKILPIIFAAKTAKDLDVNKIILVAPYLSYMRQDKRFNPGEGITSNYFAELLSRYIDELVTIDPHLHRYKSLDEIYSAPSKVLHATEYIAEYIEKNISDPVLIGPDSESEQWVKQVSENINKPYLVLDKVRHSDYKVSVSKPKVEQYLHHTPVLIDDIISTANTMIETVKHLKTINMQPPVCIGVHAVFANDGYERLLQSGVKDVVTCNTIGHISNKIDLLNLVTTIFVSG